MKISVVFLIGLLFLPTKMGGGNHRFHCTETETSYPFGTITTSVCFPARPYTRPYTLPLL